MNLLNRRNLLSFIPFIILILFISSSAGQPLSPSNKGDTETLDSLDLQKASSDAASRQLLRPLSELHEAFLARQSSSDPVSVNISTAGTNGGSDSAEQSAQQAGNTVETGQGGNRATPTSVAGFAKLLSGAFFGSILTIFAAGALLVQAWHYFERFGSRESDQLPIQMLVGLLVTLSLAQTGALIHRITEIHVLKFGDFLFALLSIGNEIAFVYITTGIMQAGVQLYYLHRCWIAFKRSPLLAAVGLFLVSFIFLGGIASGVLVLRAGSAANVKGSALKLSLSNSTGYEWSVTFAAWLSVSAFVDMSICAMLCYSLLQMKSPFWHTRYAIWRLFLLSVETCFVTTSFSVVTMILFLTSPEAFNYLITLLPIGTIHASSLLVTLMTRTSIARELAQDQIVTGAGGQPTLADEVLKSNTLDTAPNSLAKPLIKKMMKRNAKRPKAVGDLGGIGVVTTIHQEENQDDTGGFDMSNHLSMSEKGDERSLRHKTSHPSPLSEASWDDAGRPSASHSGDDSPPFPTDPTSANQASFLPPSKPRSLFGGSRNQTVGGGGGGEETTANGLPSTHPYALFEPTPFTSNMESQPTVQAAALAHSGMKMEGSKAILKEAQKAVKASGNKEVQPLKSTQKVTIARGERNPRACPWDA